MRRATKRLLKALRAANVTAIQRRMALILYQVNGLDCALKYVGGLQERFDNIPGMKILQPVVFLSAPGPPAKGSTTMSKGSVYM